MGSPSKTQKLRIAILGCGFMGTALLSGIIKSVRETDHEVKFSITAPSQSSIDRLQQEFTALRDKVDIITTNNVEAGHDADVIILGFQPQQLGAVFDEPGLVDAVRRKLVISLLAGVSSRQIRDIFSASSNEDSEQIRVSCVIPSIGAQINESATLVASDTKLSPTDLELVTWLFGLVGKTQLVPEQLISTVTAVSAATHALVVVAADAVVDGSVAEGVPRQVALAVASQCLRSASTLLQGRMTIEALKESMSVPRGITINALLQLDKGQVRSGISDAVRHAVQYAQSM